MMQYLLIEHVSEKGGLPFVQILMCYVLRKELKKQ